MMKYARLPAIVVCCLMSILVGCEIALAAGRISSPATKIIHYVPRGVWTGTKEGTCWTGSIAISRPDAWRCMVGNEIYDPCFAIENGKSVVCGASPNKNQPGFRLKLKRPLPVPDTTGESTAAAAGRGWLIELADGTFCRPATGATGVVAGRPATYYCASSSENEDVVLLGDLNTQHAMWTAEKATLVAKAGRLVLKKVEKVPIETVWQ